MAKGSKDEKIWDGVLRVGAVEVGGSCNHRGERADFHSLMSVVAIFARISPFLLHGLNGVSSVMGPLTLPYMYTLSKKISLAPGAFAGFDRVAHDPRPHCPARLCDRT